MTLRRAARALAAALALGACARRAVDAPMTAETAAPLAAPSGRDEERDAVDAGAALAVDASAAGDDLDAPDRSLALIDGYRLEIHKKRIAVFKGGSARGELKFENPILTVDASPREPIVAVVTGTYGAPEDRHRFLEEMDVRFAFLADGYSKNIRGESDNLDSYAGNSIWSPDGEYVAVAWGEVLGIVRARNLKDYIEGKVEADFRPDVRIGMDLGDGTSMEEAHSTGFVRWESPRMLRFSYGVCGSWWTKKFDLKRGMAIGRKECLEGWCLMKELRSGYFSPDKIQMRKTTDRLSVRYGESGTALVKKARPLWNRCVEETGLREQIGAAALMRAHFFLRVGDGGRVVEARTALEPVEDGAEARRASGALNDGFQRCIEPEMLEMRVNDAVETPPLIIEVEAQLHEKMTREKRGRNAGGC
jgi:hypothetical protein